jgi:hypothetical protein
VPSDPTAADVTPLDIILAVMHRRWEQDDEKGAVEMAKLAAPFVHARALPGRDGAARLDQLSDEDLADADGADDETAGAGQP